MVGSAERMLDVYRVVARIAPTTSTVLIQGETGTGKELIARATHSMRRRSHHPFVTVDCSALAESLLESELFGHVKGAFTGDRDPNAARSAR
jgi:transcriptional regulator with GAF, ATPase, and Fis domain